MHLAHEALGGERADVAADGFFRDLQPLGEGGDGEPALGADEAQHLALAQAEPCEIGLGRRHQSALGDAHRTLQVPAARRVSRLRYLWEFL